MNLSFNPRHPPYAEVAVLIKTSGPNALKTLRLTPVADHPTTTLTPAAAAAAKNPAKLTGSVAVLRYLARLAPHPSPLYDEHTLTSHRHTSETDSLLDLLRQHPFTTHHLATLTQTVHARHPQFLVDHAKLLLADYAAWGFLRVHPSKDTATWVAKMDALPECAEAVRVVDAAIAAPPLQTPSVVEVKEIPRISGTNPDENVLDAFRNLIADQIARLAGSDPVFVTSLIEAPRTPDHGDFAIAVPRMRVKGNPAVLAKEYTEKFIPNQYILSASSIGPFMNFKISHSLLNRLLLALISSQKEAFGTNTSGAGKTVVVEYSSPNIAKPFHAGHLRSTIIGNFINNVHVANGWKTITMNYLGDWGKQYAVGYNKYGKEDELEKDPTKHLYDVYVQINADAEADPTIHDAARAYFKQMEDGDEVALALWRKFRDISIIKYQSTYARLNVKFDIYSGESQVAKPMARALALLKEKNLVKDSEGALIMDLNEHKLGTTVIQKQDGAALYMTRDIGAAMERYEKFQFDSMIYVVASQQDLHLKQLFKILELMGFDWAAKCTHINFGLVSGMSTRKGTAVFLEQILEETKTAMHEVMQKNEKKYAQIEDPDTVADIIGISAVKVQDMAARRIRNYDFDWNRMFSFEGDTGPYLQYAHARLCSIERNSAIPINPDADVALLTEPAAEELITMIAQYPDLVKALPASPEPCNVVTYAFKLSHIVSIALEGLWVMGQEKKLAEARLLMYWAARITLGNAMRLIGLTPLERM
ncbi:hypothetical protein BC938DRAFT_471984 [Jimgerdemannia flammicorona]|uniref:arginine--tRNA ligase n=1 Tax=Jimgerdemannia flammicorona TaxID=994334 RepID=A0A433QUA0_9FUNG|nr:hypothetical protein BC938DRAFT_471984 [Jimgerdemannia flammicorona]